MSSRCYSTHYVHSWKRKFIHTRPPRIALVKLHQSSGAAVCTSGRVLHALDGACLGVDPDVDGEKFVDTSCMLFTREAFDVFPVWAAMSPQFHAIDDRVVWAEVLDRRLTRAHSALPWLGPVT